jgi:SAM-dependent methyltransferase
MSTDIENLKRKWDEHAQRYDAYYEKFEGAVENYVDWELLKLHLPKNEHAKILDAAGGTGRMTLPLAKMGYSVTLCDISPGMLSVARQKLQREGMLDKVEIFECDVRKLPFPDESFEFILSWDGGIEAAKELVRVAKKGGQISIYLVNLGGSAIHKFREDPEAALDLLKKKSDYVYDEGEKYLAVNADDAAEVLAKEGIRVIETCAVCGLMEWLSVSDEMRKSRKWDEKYFGQVCEMLLRLSKLPSVKGLSRHLLVYGEKA